MQEGVTKRRLYLVSTLSASLRALSSAGDSFMKPLSRVASLYVGVRSYVDGLSYRECLSERDITS